MTEASAFTWPRRREPGDWRRTSAAVAVLTFDLDAESPLLAAGAHHARDLSAMSHQAYGPRVGVPRIVELLRRHDVTATFFVTGWVAEHWPDQVRLVVDSGHEVALHSHTHRPLVSLTEVEQRDDLERGLAALDALDIEPVGYRAPNWQLTRETLERLPAAGIHYDSSLMDDDRPYVIQADQGAVAELPVHWCLDDWEQYCYVPGTGFGSQIETPAKVLELWTAELDAMRETGSLCVVTCHPFLSGRPSRALVIGRFIEFVRDRGDVELCTAGEVARRALGGTP